MSDMGMMGAADPEALAHPQPMYKMLRDVAPVVPIEGMVIVGGDEDIREVLHHPEVFSSGVDAVHIGQVRPLIPLQIDPPQHKNFRKLLDPIFAPKQVAKLEDSTRSLVKDLIAGVVDDGRCNFHDRVAEPLPSTVFLQLLGLPVSRAKEFIALKDGIIRPRGVHNEEERRAAVDVAALQIYAVLDEVIEERASRPRSTATASPTTTSSTSASCSSSPGSTR
jgi:cytochrome P450